MSIGVEQERHHPLRLSRSIGPTEATASLEVPTAVGHREVDGVVGSLLQILETERFLNGLLVPGLEKGWLCGSST